MLHTHKHTRTHIRVNKYAKQKAKVFESSDSEIRGNIRGMELKENKLIIIISTKKQENKIIKINISSPIMKVQK